MTTKTDTSNLNPALPDYVRAAVDTLAAFVDTQAVKPGARADGTRQRTHELIAALNKLA